MQMIVAEKNWVADLALVFSGRADKTVLVRRTHSGPLVVQKPFYPEGDVCHVYLLHPPGGIVGGDELHLKINVENSGHALVTTPAAGKFYRSDGRTAELTQQFSLAAGTVLEWLPQETILFSGCRARQKTRVDLEGAAKFIGWEIVCIGRPASGEIFDQGFVQQHFELWRNNLPLAIDRARLEGGSELLTASWGMQGYTATGTMMATGADENLLHHVREHLQPHDTVLLSATLIEDVLIVRALSHQAETLRNQFIEVWKLIRPALLARQACIPRIWAT